MTVSPELPLDLTPEFNSQVIMTGPDYMDNSQAINPYMHPDAEKINNTKAIVEHDQIGSDLRDIGVDVIKTDAAAGLQDYVFAANFGLLAKDEKTILIGQLPGPREAEKNYYIPLYERLGKTVLRLPNENWLFSGQGDALRYGGTLLSGQGFRTRPGPEIHDFIAEKLDYDVLSLQTVPLLGPDGTPVLNAETGLPDSLFYDIDYAIGVLRWPQEGRPGILAVCKEAFDDDSLAKLTALTNTEIIWVPFAEATGVSACNLVSTGKAVVMNAGAPVTEQGIRDKGLYVRTRDNPEHKKNGGSVRCTTGTVRHVPLAA